MQTVIVVVHLMIVLALVGVVLMQRSEGGGLGIGGGSGFMTARGAANALTRATAILAAAFFVTSLGLSLLARYGERPMDILDRVPTQQNGTATGRGVLDQLGGSTPSPASGTTAPAANAPAAGTTAPATTAPAAGAANAPAPTAPSTSVPASNGSTAPAGSAAPAQPQVPNN